MLNLWITGVRSLNLLLALLMETVLLHISSYTAAYRQLTLPVIVSWECSSLSLCLSAFYSGRVITPILNCPAVAGPVPTRRLGSYSWHCGIRGTLFYLSPHHLILCCKHVCCIDKIPLSQSAFTTCSIFHGQGSC